MNKQEIISDINYSIFLSNKELTKGDSWKEEKEAVDILLRCVDKSIRVIKNEGGTKEMYDMFRELHHNILYMIRHSDYTYTQSKTINLLQELINKIK